MIQAYFSRTYYLLYSETSLTLYRVQGQNIADKVEFGLSSTDDFPALLARVRQHYPLKAEDNLIVGLPLRLFNLVNFSLPRAAEENLDEAIGYELTRHVPYELDACLFHTAAVVQGDHLQITATLALKETLQPYLAALSAAGLSVTAIAPALVLAAWMTNRDGIFIHCPEPFTEFLVYRHHEVAFSTTVEIAVDGEKDNFVDPLTIIQNYRDETDQLQLWDVSGAAKEIVAAWSQPPEQVEIDIAVATALPPEKNFPYKIDLISTQMRRRKLLKNWLKAAACLFFLLSLTAYPVAFFAGKTTVLKNLEEKLEVVRQRAQALDSLRQDNQAMIERYEKLADYVRSRPQVLDALKEITDIIPTDTWLNSLQLHGRHLILRGTAVEATTVIEALVDSPLLQDVQFDSPVVKKGSRETFTIVAGLK